ncbi:MAG TPA: cyclic nucleotide-binding domain-containing protein [Opitutaceae bacterium]|nr:cyclic nucleotide-binding domain-containing protein [Opitutaceae bacterium]
MSSILDLFQDHAVRRFAPGELILEGGKKAGILFVLLEGAIEVRKGSVVVDFVREPGAVFGEISALLNSGHTADVRAAEASALYVIEEPHKYLREHPEFHLHVSELLARRLSALVKYLTDVKQQYEGHDHLGMVDEVLETLVHRQPRKRGV